MCLAVPSKVLKIEGENALVKCEGIKVEVSIALFPELNVGDLVLIHAGFVIQKLEEMEASDIYEALNARQNIPELHPKFSG